MRLRQFVAQGAGLPPLCANIAAVGADLGFCSKVFPAPAAHPRDLRRSLPASEHGAAVI